MPAHLLHVYEHRAYPLDRESFFIGRDATMDVVLREPNVSRRHLEIRNTQGSFRLVPHGSGAIRINGDPIAGEVSLEDGDSIGVAYETFIFTTGPLPLGASVIEQRIEQSADPDTLRPTIVHTALTDPVKRTDYEPSVSWAVFVVVAVVIAIAAFVALR
jgi:pSer/pThr/pTyr-binding forkhead associated (FHA) protein